ncbi:MAG: hypothetical protein ACRCT1_07145 [Microcoleaceae cyanobacterium]
MAYARVTYTLNQFIDLLNANSIKPDSTELRNVVSQAILSDDPINLAASDTEQGEIYVNSGDCIFFSLATKTWDLFPGNFIPSTYQSETR